MMANQLLHSLIAALLLLVHAASMASATSGARANGSISVPQQW
jgi:hypothetical protein